MTNQGRFFLVCEIGERNKLYFFVWKDECILFWIIDLRLCAPCVSIALIAVKIEFYAY